MCRSKDIAEMFSLSLFLRMTVDDIESIEVYTHQGKYFTKEIGRLKMFQELERRKRKVTIPVIVKDKATTKTEGESVKSIRRKQQEGSQPGQEGPKPGISKLKRRKEREHSRERKRQRSDPWSQDV